MVLSEGIYTHIHAHTHTHTSYTKGGVCVGRCERRVPFCAIDVRLRSYGADGAAHSSYEFRRTLIGGPEYDPAAPVPAFLPTMWKLNKDMLFGSASINTPHQWESKYYQWVLNLKGLLFYGCVRAWVPSREVRMPSPCCRRQSLLALRGRVV